MGTGAFEMFPEGWDRGAISYLEGGGFRKNWSIVAERIRDMFD